MKIVYKETFVKRLEKQLKYLSDNSPKSAKKLKTELIKRIKEIPENPYLFRKSIYFENDLIRDMFTKAILLCLELMRIKLKYLDLRDFKKTQLTKLHFTTKN